MTLKKTDSARELALSVLTKVEEDKSFSNIQLNQTLIRSKLNRQDKGLVTEIVYGTIMHLNTIDWFLSFFLPKPLHQYLAWLRNLLRLSVYQLWYLERIPNSAIVNEAVKIAKKRSHQGIANLVNAVLRNFIRKRKEIEERFANLPENERLSLFYSHPKWLIDKWIWQYGTESTKLLCVANNQAPFTSIRTNRLMISRDELINLLIQEYPEADIKPSILVTDGIRIKGAGNIIESKYYAKGFFSVQDESAMLVARIVNPMPNKKVLDVAAAPGGKTLHMAELMNNQGSIIATDLYEHKLNLINEQATRLHINIIKTIQADGRDLEKKLNNQLFDYILLDAPCSGLGILRRKPEIKWNRIPTDITSLAKIQRELLDSASKLLKKDGVLVYSTCTLIKEENELVIANFLNKNNNFILDEDIEHLLPKEIGNKLKIAPGMLQILPFYFETDGFFIARLKKIAN